MFGVIVCPKCNRVRGIDLSIGRAVCPRCGHPIDIDRAKVYFRTESQRELVEAVRQKAREIAPSLDPAELEDWAIVKDGIDPPEQPERGISEDRVYEIARRLTADQGEFIREDLKRELGCGEDEVDGIVERTLSAGVIYEPRRGMYRTV